MLPPSSRSRSSRITDLYIVAVVSVLRGLVAQE